VTAHHVLFDSVLNKSVKKSPSTDLASDIRDFEEQIARVPEMVAMPSERPMIAFGVLVPFLYGGLGYLSTLIGAIILNWAVGNVGGIQVTLASGEA